MLLRNFYNIYYKIWGRGGDVSNEKMQKYVLLTSQCPSVTLHITNNSRNAEKVCINLILGITEICHSIPILV